MGVINVTITAESADELKDLLHGFKALVHEGSITGVSVSATAADPASETGSGGTNPASAGRTRTRTPAAQAATADPAPAGDPPEQQAFGITLADVQTKLRELSKAGKSTEVKKLLDRFGVPNLSSLPEDKLEDISAEADLI